LKNRDTCFKDYPGIRDCIGALRPATNSFLVTEPYLKTHCAKKCLLPFHGHYHLKYCLPLDELPLRSRVAQLLGLFRVTQALQSDLKMLKVLVAGINHTWGLLLIEYGAATLPAEPPRLCSPKVFIWYFFISNFLHLYMWIGLAAWLICRDQSWISKFKLAPVFLSKIARLILSKN
jgi:hypothetical protein